MPTYTVHEAKTNLSKLIDWAERGEEVIIARGNKPVVRLTPTMPVTKPAREPGTLKGKIKIPRSFFDTISEDDLTELEEGHVNDPLALPTRPDR